MKRYGLLALELLLSVAVTSYSDTWYVATNSMSDGPGMAWSNAWHTIQDAVDAASDSDMVLVTNGVYRTGGKQTPYREDPGTSSDAWSRIVVTQAIAIVSVNGAEATVIEGTTNGVASMRCATLSGGAVLNGFTLSNGFATVFGDMPADWGGGGALLTATCELRNCIVTDSEAQGGGGVYCNLGGSVVNSLVVGNRSFGANGGGIVCSDGGNVINSTVSGNHARSYGGGIYFYSAGQVRNTIVYDNTADAGDPNWHIGNPGTCAWQYTCTTPTNDLPDGAGCIQTDPIFFNAASGDYRLAPASPCINSGTNGVWTDNVTDLDGHLRVVDGTVDIGAYEYRFAFVDISNTNDSVFGEVATTTISGSNSAGTVGTMAWTNAANGANGVFSAAGEPAYDWQVSGIPLAIGANTITVTGTNAVGAMASDSVTITRMFEHGGDSPIHYVSPFGTSVYPYTTRETAATSIQTAVDAASVGDTVLVEPGHYTPGAQISVAKVITVKGIRGAETVTIDGLNTHRCFYMNADAVIDGFTITAGRAYGNGGGVYCGGNGTIQNCTIAGNSVYGGDGNGGGVYCGGNGTIQNCTIAGNSVYGGDGGDGRDGGITGSGSDGGSGSRGGHGKGGGVYGGTVQNCAITGNSVYGGDGGDGGDGIIIGRLGGHGGDGGSGSGGGVYGTTVQNCTITGNSVYGGDGGDGGRGYSANGDGHGGNGGNGHGGGVYGGTVQNCTITGNSVYGGDAGDGVNTIGDGTFKGGGVYGGTIQNCIIWNNAAGTSPDNWFSGTFSYSCTTPLPSGTDNTNAIPGFAGSSLYLVPDSPCIDSGTNTTAITNDVNGVPRPLDGDGDGTNTCDMGAHEFVRSTVDSDGDGLNDRYEVYVYGTDMTNSDSDGDGQNDGDEVAAGTDPSHDDSAAVASVTNNPAAYGLYTSNSISDLSMGAMMLQTSNGWMRLNLQLEQCTNLVEGVWTNVGDSVEWLEPAADGKAFLRVHGR